MLCIGYVENFAFSRQPPTQLLYLRAASQFKAEGRPDICSSWTLLGALSCTYYMLYIFISTFLRQNIALLSQPHTVFNPSTFVTSLLFVSLLFVSNTNFFKSFFLTSLHIFYAF